MVALAVFGLAALALLRLGGATAANTARLHDQALAQIVARNLMVEAMTDPRPPAFGRDGGTVENGGHAWRWTRIVARSPEPRLQQVEVRITGQSGGDAARLVFFRSTAR